jgi:hypothetical protein
MKLPTSDNICRAAEPVVEFGLEGSDISPEIHP